MELSGFEIVCDVRNEMHDGWERALFSPPFRTMSDEDAATSTAFVQARRKF
jgi:hypothetical protein